MSNSIIPSYPVFLPYRQGCWIPPNYAEDCKYYEEDIDMGARIPICMKNLKIDSNDCNKSCPNYRNKYEQLISKTETEPYKYEDNK